MQKVPAWSATDGRVFTDRAVCKAHDAYLSLRAMVAEAGVSTDDDVERVTGHLVAHREDAIALLRKAAEAPPS